MFIPTPTREAEASEARAPPREWPVTVSVYPVCEAIWVLMAAITVEEAEFHAAT
jgi:hypothetical protein